MSAKRKAVVLAVHGLLLGAPALLSGRGHVLVTPRGIACVGLLLLLSLLEPMVLRSSSPPTSLRDGSLALTSGVGLLLTAWLAIIGAAGASSTWCWLGAVAAGVGIALRVLAIRDLGPSFTSAIEPSGRLVVGGIYGRVRHPSDLGLLLIATGIALLGGSVPAGVVVAAGVVPSIALRLIREERALFAQFGPAHQAYRERVAALLPIPGRG